MNYWFFITQPKQFAENIVVMNQCNIISLYTATPFGVQYNARLINRAEVPPGRIWDSQWPKCRLLYRTPRAPDGALCWVIAGSSIWMCKER